MIIAGATATGKSAVAQWIAEQIGAAIISADSMLVYRGLDIGTAKPTPEERQRVKYIGVDCVAPSERFSTGDWLEFVWNGIAALPCETPLIVAGGTGLYIKALMQGLDAPPGNPAVRCRFQAIFEKGGIDALHSEIAMRNIALPQSDFQNPRRLLRALERFECQQFADAPHLASIADNSAPRGMPNAHISSLNEIFSSAPVFLLTMDRDALATRIEQRAHLMFDNGIVDEALAFFGNGSTSETAAGAIGYAEALAFARSEISRSDAIEKIATRTRQLAKRQRTWFRHQLASATEIPVLDGDSASSVGTKIIADFLA